MLVAEWFDLVPHPGSLRPLRRSRNASKTARCSVLGAEGLEYPTVQPFKLFRVTSSTIGYWTVERLREDGRWKRDDLEGVGARK